MVEKESSRMVLLWGQVEGVFSTGRVISNPGMFSHVCSAIAGLFIIPRSVFHIMVFKCMYVFVCSMTEDHYYRGNLWQQVNFWLM